MAIEKVGDDPESKRRVTCRNCGSVLEYLPIDIESRTVTDYTGDSEIVRFIRCPVCKKEVIVKMP